MKKQNRVIYYVNEVVSKGFFGNEYKRQGYTLKVNKKGEIILGDKLD